MMVGVLGAGQLGRMLALAGVPLGMRFRFFDPAPDSVAGHVGELVVGDWGDRATLERFARGLDACTLEFENVPVATHETVSATVPVRPGARALATSQDRVLEKSCFERLGIPTTLHRAVDTREELAEAVREVGLPCVLKSRRLGYDGKGQCVVRSDDDGALDEAWRAVAGRASIVEEFVPFDREVSIIGARGADGACVFYPLTWNTHAGGILRLSVAPAPGVSYKQQVDAENALRAVMEHLDYVGVLTIEFFERDRKLIANEMAPRVHNSGHWTIEGASCSQFENHLRAVCGLPLAVPFCRAAAMVNLIGSHAPLRELARVPGARVHLYGKEIREGRKVGHVTLVGDDPVDVYAATRGLRAMANDPSLRTP